MNRNKKGQFVKGHGLTPKGHKRALGYRHTTEARKKISLSKIGKKRLDLAKRNKEKTWTKEMKEKISEANKGRKPSKGTKRKMSEAQKRIGNKPPIKRGEESYLWKGGISFEPYSTDWTEILKQIIRERDKYICQTCNNYGNIVHHIDYNKKNCNLDNLIILCGGCHSKTNQNRKYWIQYFQNKIKLCVN